MGRRRWLSATVALVSACVIVGFGLCSAAEVIGADELQAAIDSCEAGGELVLAAGRVYKGPVYVDKSITMACDAFSPRELPLFVKSIDDLSAVFDRLALPTPTYIDGGVYIAGGRVVLKGLTINSQGTAVTVVDGSVDLENCSILARSYGVDIQGASSASIRSSFIRMCDVGVVVQAASEVFIEGSLLLANWTGVRAFGRVTLLDSQIMKSGFGDRAEPQETHGGNGIELMRGATAILERDWITENTGVAIWLGFAVGEEWHGEARVQGRENVIPGPKEPRANVKGALGDLAFEELPEGGVADVWPDGLLARSYSSKESFVWYYLGKRFELEAALEIEPGCSDGTLRGGEPNSAEYASQHYTNTTTIDGLSKDIVAIAAGRGYPEHGLADLVLAFVSGVVKYDYPRYENRTPGYQVPVITLAKRTGVCRDQAVLAAVMLESCGLDCVLVSLEPKEPQTESHMVVGVAVADAWGESIEVDGTRYFLADTTAGGSLGGFDLSDWGPYETIAVEPAAEIITEMRFSTFDELALCGALGVLTIRNRGNLKTERGTVCIATGWWVDTPLNCVVHWVLPALVPGEEIAFEVPRTGLVTEECGEEGWAKAERDGQQLEVVSWLYVSVFADQPEGPSESLFYFSPNDWQGACP